MSAAFENAHSDDVSRQRSLGAGTSAPLSKQVATAVSLLEQEAAHCSRFFRLIDARELRALAVALPSLVEDTARLDWLEHTAPNLNYVWDEETPGRIDGVGVDHRLSGRTLSTGPTIRDAIDAARRDTAEVAGASGGEGVRRHADQTSDA